MAEESSIQERRINSKFFTRVIYFFPVQLLFLHIKRNHILLLFWLVLFLYVSGNLGVGFGIDTLFLAPIYMGEIGAWSFLIMGFSLGGFIMAFHIYSYILFSRDFTFLATLSRPFLKFCLNNMLIPSLFILTYLVQIFLFLTEEELMNSGIVFIYIICVLVGLFVFYILSILYFIQFNKNVFVISGKTETYFENLGNNKVKESNFIKKKKNSRVNVNKNTWRVDTYLSNFFSINIARSTKHYDKELIQKVFTQNHVNASIFELALIISFLGIGFFRDISWLNIPAGASIFLLFTLLIMLFSILYSWFKGWTLTFLILAIVSFNFLTNRFHLFQFRNYAYGLNYDLKPKYDHENISELQQDKLKVENSIKENIEILTHWSQIYIGINKPKMVFINTSGGGLRSALWTVHVLNFLDSITKQRLTKQTHLITGASGGMIGAAFYRENYKKGIYGETMVNGNEMKRRISKDLLNPLAFSIATTDMFYRFKKHDDGKYIYTKDRGWFFEKNLIENLNCFEGKRILDYKLPEYHSDIPMMIFSPSVVNDGRRLLISPQKITFLCNTDTSLFSGKIALENIEFSTLFNKNDPQYLKISSAMRMNATFPYILPMVFLPSEPKIEVMDAGLRDNLGLTTSIKYIDNFKNWIHEHTSGVVIIQLRDREKKTKIKDKQSGSLISKLFTPLTNVYGNFLKIQDYRNDEMLNQLKSSFKGDIHYVEFSLKEGSSDEISMSWHLTSKDINQIYEQLNTEENQKSLQKVSDLLLH